MARNFLILPVCFVLLSCNMSKEEQRVVIIFTVISAVIAVLAIGGGAGSKRASTGSKRASTKSCPTLSTSDVSLDHTHSDSVLLHGGGLDSSGCHRDNRRGGRHCHRSAPAPTPRPAPAPRPAPTPSISAPAC